MLSGKMLPFPSPLGEMGLSIYIMAKVTELNALEFPSPLGEMGLSIRLDVNNCGDKATVSVPSRGNGVIDKRKQKARQSCGQGWVSVPSRGNGVIDCKAVENKAERIKKFPSPLGEMGLSIVLTILAQRDNSRVHSIYQYLTHAFSILK